MQMKRSNMEAAIAIESWLRAAGWVLQDTDDLGISKSGGMAVRALPLARDYGLADYLLYVEGKAAGFIEIDTESDILSGVDPLAEKYRRGLPIILPVHTRPLPFLYQSNGAQIRFTNLFDSEPHARPLFAFHKSETLKTWLEDGMIGSMPRDMVAADSFEHGRRGATLQERLWINMPPVVEEGLSLEQCDAITAIERSLRKNNTRVLVQMSAAARRRAAALHLIDRLLRFADARRVLFLVNSANIARDVHHAFQDYRSPYLKAASTSIHTVQLIAEAIDTSAKVCITTLPRMHSLLNTASRPKPTEALSPEEIFKTVAPLQYNPDLPIETFDIVVIDTCSAPLTRHFRRVLDYFDAYVIGLTGEVDEEALALFDGHVVGGEQGDGLEVIV